ncbi:nicotinate phosphoribosyltransferase [Mycobacterium sp.]|uniref:nicotinate phosphoribosyltransferase n=1 Tax=Mycobacterium sp. TaxID=1785 RepID=UPI003A86B5D1
MLSAALRDGTAHRRTTWDVFARELPPGRRYGVVAGTGRLLETLPQFRFDDSACDLLAGFLDADTVDFLRDFQFTGDIDGYPEGELYFPDSPVLSVHGSFAECMLLETLVLSIFNHDTAIASGAARMVSAAGGRRLIDMGSRRTHERAAVAAARAAYLAGFAGTSNLQAQWQYGVPAEGTAAHSFTMVHTTEDRPDELSAFCAQVTAFGPGTTLLVDTYDVPTGVAHAVSAAGPTLGAVRIDSGDLGVLAKQVRHQLDELGMTETAILASGDLDEFAIARLAKAPIDTYGVGTSLVTGSGAPTAGMVYKLVEVDGIPVRKDSVNKESHGGRKAATRLARPNGTIIEELVHPFGRTPAHDISYRVLTTPLVRKGEVLSDADTDTDTDADADPDTDTGSDTRSSTGAGSNAPNDLVAARERVAAGLRSLPQHGLNLAPGEPAIPTRIVRG